LLVSALRLVRTGTLRESQKLIVCAAQARSRRFETFLLGTTLIAFSPFRAIALRNYQNLSVPRLARLMDFQASLWQRL